MALSSPVCRYNDIGAMGVDCIARALEANASNNLKSLVVSWNPLYDEGVLTAVRLLPVSKIEDLQVDSTKCTDRACAAVAECILKYGNNLCLKSLSIIQNKYFSNGGMELESAASKYGIRIAKDASLVQLRNPNTGKSKFDSPGVQGGLPHIS